MPTPDLIDLLIRHAAPRAIAALGRWLSPAEIERNLRDEIESLLRNATPVGAPAVAGRASVVTVNGPHGSIALLAVARLHADSRPLPHAVIPYRTADPHADDLPALLDAVVARFGALGVDRMCVFSHGDDAAWPMTAPRVTIRPYKRYIAGSIAELEAGEPPLNAERVVVRDPADLGFYPAYEAMYRDFWAASPHLRDVIGIETPDDLDEFRRAGGLRLVEVDGELAGVVGAVRRTEHGMRGWRLRERVMSRNFRGAGFATAALWRFARDVPHEPGDCIWGTIMHENQPSMRSALRVGRVDVGGLAWVGR